MTIRRAKFLLNDINTRIDAMNPADSERSEERTVEQENELTLEAKREQDQKVMANYLYKQNQHQNERTDEDKKRARDAERVLGREMYGRARQRVYGS